MSRPTRRTLLTGATTSLALLSPLGSALAQGRRPFDDGIDGGIDGGLPYDDERLYRDEDGRLYRRRGGRYEPYREPVSAPRGRRGSEAPLDNYDDPYAPQQVPPPSPSQGTQAATKPVDNGPIDWPRAYAAVTDEPFPVHAFNYKRMNPAFLRQDVAYTGPEAPGTILIDPRAHQLTLVQPGGRARRYGVGVGKQGFSWSGVSTVNSKQMWPDWYPPKEMIARTPKLARSVSQLRSGLGVPGGSGNPLGARAHYLWQGNKDTLYRIHGTLEPDSIGKSVSSGCIRMINQDVIDLYGRVEIGSRVVVMG